MATATFDPEAYKETTCEQWQQAAAAWHRWGPTLEAWLGEATEAMLDLARVGEGDRMLDVAAGAGGQTLAAAGRVGSQGAVLASDISANILEFAASEARAAGLGNVATRVMDGEALDVDDCVFDAVISRLGLMYFPDQQRALTEMRRALRPGGGGSRRSCSRRRSATSSSRSRSRSSAGSLSCRRLLPAFPGRSASGNPACSRRHIRRRAFARSRLRQSRRQSASRRPPSALASSGSPLAPSTRCSPALPSPSGSLPGPRSRRACGNSRGRTGSSARASCSSELPRNNEATLGRGSGASHARRAEARRGAQPPPHRARAPTSAQWNYCLENTVPETSIEFLLNARPAASE